jgi:hypothetical protein
VLSKRELEKIVVGSLLRPHTVHVLWRHSETSTELIWPNDRTTQISASNKTIRRRPIHHVQVLVGSFGSSRKQLGCGSKSTISRFEKMVCQIWYAKSWGIRRGSGKLLWTSMAVKLIRESRIFCQRCSFAPSADTQTINVRH